MRVFFEKREELTTNVWYYFFLPERPLGYIPGQYVDFRIPHDGADNRGMSRTFTLTSLPSEKHLSFVVKFEEPSSTYKKVLQALQPGGEATITDAMGDLILPKSTDVPLVFVGGGIGIASFASMFKQLLATREERNIFLFYAVRHAREQIFRDLTQAYPLQLKTITIAPNRLSAKQIIDSTPPNGLIYLSGSEKFVEGLRADLQTQGIAHEQIIFDFFDGYAEL